jgi:hypothetical protein
MLTFKHKRASKTLKDSLSKPIIKLRTRKDRNSSTLLVEGTPLKRRLPISSKLEFLDNTSLGSSISTMKLNPTRRTIRILKKRKNRVEFPSIRPQIVTPQNDTKLDFIRALSFCSIPRQRKPNLGIKVMNRRLAQQVRSN